MAVASLSCSVANWARLAPISAEAMSAALTPPAA
jgi:hypothetical protein